MDQFDQQFASHWDELVGWETRAAVDLDFLHGIIEKHGCRSALDVALGTGFHSIQLLLSGMSVASVDVSPAMIAVSEQNAINHGVELEVVCSDWVNLTQHLSRGFDCILCLGNSLACELELEKRFRALEQWSELLNDDGIIIVDRRNYEAMLAGEYDLASRTNYFGESVAINSDKISASETIFSYQFSSGETFKLKMFPVMDKEMRSLGDAAGLLLDECFGDRLAGRIDMGVGLYHYVFKKARHA